MIKKIILISFYVFAGWAAGYAQDQFCAEDMANQSILIIQGDKMATQCQAVRILPKWYLTAAHCVSPYCDKECTITANLLQGELQASASIQHTSASPHVFVPAAYHPNSAKGIRSDIALIRFVPMDEDYFFYETRSSTPLDRETFIHLLNSSQYTEQRNQWQALSHARPKLLMVTHALGRQILFPIAVPDLRSGEIYFRQSDARGFYYFPQLRHYIGYNFGVERGMSGAGVVLPGGAVVGIVSAALNRTGQLVTYNEKDEPISSIPFSSDYFMFTPVSKENAAFIRATINSFHESGAGPNIVILTAPYSQSTTDKLQDIFPEFATEQDVSDAKKSK